MPFSFQPYGIVAILIMVGIVSINELVKYLRSHRH
jgi:hypothetical protein